MSMRSIALLALLLPSWPSVAAQQPATILLSACRTEAELQGFAAQLGRLREQVVADPQTARALCAALAADAVRAMANSEPVGRVLGARALGFAIRFTEADPQAWQVLTRACRDEARCVRAEAVRQLAQARSRTEKLLHKASVALHVVEQLDAGDDALLQVAQAGRARMQALLQELKTAKDPTGGKDEADPPAAPGLAAPPTLLPARPHANEAAAIAALKNISSAQAQAQASGVIDTDSDGVGEYGYFRELSGVVCVRGDQEGGSSERRMVPPVLSGAFGKVEQGVVVRSGYCFAVFLPGKDSRLLGEGDQGGRGRCVRADQAEVRWCAYAWPRGAPRPRAAVRSTS
jgi:hypothetical protein